MKQIEKILFITLSNMGDVILTLPVLDALKLNFPEAKIWVMVGPRPKEIFENNPYIDKLIIYDKYAALREKMNLFFALKKERFDIVIDLRNTLFGALLPSRFRTSPFLYIPSHIKHMKERNLYRLYKALKMQEKFIGGPIIKKSLFIGEQDKDYVNCLLEKNNIHPNDKIVIIAPVARGANRRWEKEKFACISRSLSQDYKVILVGEDSDKAVTQYISNNCQSKIFDFAGLTNLKGLAYLIQKASLVIVCDTGILHLASYMAVPVLGLFGASDEVKYGPWSEKSIVIKKEIFCRPCQEAQCRFGTIKCMRLIKAEDVLNAVKDMLVTKSQSHKVTKTFSDFKRILIVRTDRIGDVLLSTPVIKALRSYYPDAYISMMVSSYAKDIVEGNPYLDEVIVYDKDKEHKSWWRSFGFTQELKIKKFDLALMLHPTNRVHLVTFFAGIKKRVGYNRKLGFLLTDRLEHSKQRGEKHEAEYNFDLLRYLGIEAQEKELFMPLRKESEEKVNDLFKQMQIKDTDTLLAIHPGASCPSKIWPCERFAEVADKLVEKYGFKVLVVAGPKDIRLAESVIKNMHHPSINLAGKSSVSQLASILKRCRLFISNDSGPVHIATAVGTPVIAIFGRSQAGLSPKRWGPLGIKDKILHKQVGCIECLAHNCIKEFACLKAISVDDVVSAADEILK
ncbi:MAG: lipopolysaccharide heptosyltransferase II [Candidatus Omnitrophota bacterium]